MTETERWEYRTKTFGSLLSTISDEELEGILASWGDEGWEVISAFAVPGTYKFRVIAKRIWDQRIDRSRTMRDY